MKFKAIAAAVVVLVSVPLAMQDAEGQTPSKEKRYCEVDKTTGSRLGAIRRCRTKAERDAARAEGKSTIERIQSQKNFTEAMSTMRGQACKSMPRGC
jgi:hypothetical protein